MTRLLLAISIAVALPAVAIADNKADAQDHLVKAAAAYKDKRWQDAIDELNKAYVLDPNPNLHFSIGQVYVKMGRCSDAVIEYDEYLSTRPGSDNAQVAREAIASCKSQEATTPPPPKPEDKPPDPVPEPPVVAPPVVVPPHVDQVGDRWYQDKLGVALVGGGAGLVVASIVVYALARGTLSDADNAATYGKQVDLYDSARSKRTVSVVLGLGGLVAGGFGVYHYRTKSHSRMQGVGVVPARDGSLVTWTTGF